MLFGKRKRIVKRVLIIEDEPLTAFDNEVILRDCGLEVVATHDDYEEALAALDREQVDLILSDVRLRGDRTGIDLAHEAKKRGIPLLFITGYPPDNAHELAIGCLLKPYNDRTMRQALDAIDRHLGGKPGKPPKGLELYPIERAEPTG
ncbi:MAG TPA: response regulator [Sphingomicrobium sp.]|nr:response regulator [Sphingomicrobium sp.]